LLSLKLKNYLTPISEKKRSYEITAKYEQCGRDVTQSAQWVA